MAIPFFTSPFAKSFIPPGRLLLLLDFDGTLAPIVRRPERARLPTSVRRQLQAAARRRNVHVGVISGRPMSFIRERIRLPGIIYVGNHGYEFKWPGSPVRVHPAARRARAAVREAKNRLLRSVSSLKGVEIEDKTWSVTMHTRRAGRTAAASAVKQFRSIVAPFLRAGRVAVKNGKKVLEIVPPGNWNKGKAVLEIARRFPNTTLAVYVGDDRTDEDAFRALRGRGVGIHVGNAPTAAAYRLRSPRDIPRLLRFFARHLS